MSEYCMDIKEYDKITVLNDPRDIISKLAKIEKPYSSVFDDNDKIVILDEEQWYNINYAIKLIMDAYGIHNNWDLGLFIDDDAKGDILKMYNKPKYWWLDKFKTKWNNETNQTETIM